MQVKRSSFSLNLAMVFCLSTPALWADEKVESPDGALVVTLSTVHGHPAYQVSYQGQTAIETSPLGLYTNEWNLTENLTIQSADRQSIDETYTLERAKKSTVHYEANKIVVTYANPSGRELQVEMRVSNHDIALRYLLAKQGETGSVRITGEATGFAFPEGTTSFMCSQSDAMIGWKRTKPSYEELYMWDAPLASRSQYGHGYTFPVLFKSGDEKEESRLWTMISETGVDGNYCGAHLSDVGYNPLFKNGSVFSTSVLNTFSVAYPMAEENNGFGTPDASIALPGATPWRTITIGRTLAPIAETTAPWDNVTPRFTSSNTYKMGHGTWSWILWQDGSINYHDLCQYVDFAQSMGYEYILIDNYWDTNLGKESNGTAKDPSQSIESLIRYAKQRGVDVLLWYSSSGHWNDIVQGPTNLMDNAIVRKREMRWLKEVGVKGIKVDFFGGDKQETMRLYEEILSDADDYGLMVIFHGCTLPRGWERMYPNYVGSEAVLASENLIFDQPFCDLEARHATLHPVLRNTVGCMEFGGSFQNHYMNRANKPSENGRVNERRTTSTFSLATAVLYQNPIQNFALAPGNLIDAPAVSMQFMREVPTTWDEIRFLDGYPGRYVALARRHADTWYIAAVSAASGTTTITLNLDFLPTSASLTLYAGGNNPSAKPLKVGKGGKCTLSLKENDGFVIVAK